jgi:hypothetical protein
VLWLAGLGLLALVSPQPGRWPPLGRLGLGFGLGLLAVPHALFLASLLGLTPGWGIGIGVALAAWGAAFAVRGRTALAAGMLARAEPAAVRSRGRVALEWALRGLILASCGLAGWLALEEPLVEWDVLAIWAYKARILLGAPLFPGDWLADPTRAYAHLDYPLLWPFAMSWIWTGAGSADLLAVKWLAPALLFAFAATFHALLSRSVDRTTALLFTALLMGTPMLLSQSVRLQADVPLAYFASAAGALVYLWLRGRCPDGVRLAGLFACGALLTKNEGMALYAVLGAATAVALCFRGDAKLRRSAALWLLGLPALLTSPWFALRAGIPKLHEDYASRLAPPMLWENAGRIPEILSGALGYLGAPQDWLFVWPALALLLVATAGHWWRRPALLYLLALAELPLLLYVGVFAVTPWQPAVLMEAAASRLLLHSFPLQLLLAAEIVRSAALLPWLGQSQGNAAGAATPPGREEERGPRDVP